MGLAKRLLIGAAIAGALAGSALIAAGVDLGWTEASALIVESALVLLLAAIWPRFTKRHANRS